MTEQADAAAEAVAAVRDAGVDPDSALGISLATEILRHRLESGGMTESRPVAEAVEHPATDLDGPDRVAAWAGVSREALLDIASFGPESADLEIHTSLLPPAKAARQRLLAMLKLGVDRIAYGRNEVPAREINEICGRFDCLDQNLPAHLVNYENFITRKGGRGTATYRLTQYGLDEASEALRALVNAD